MLKKTSKLHLFLALSIYFRKKESSNYFLSPGQGCSNSLRKPRVGEKFELRYKALKTNSFLFFLFTIWWLDMLKRIAKIIWGNTFEQKKKKLGLKFNLGLVLISLQTTGPWSAKQIINNNIGWGFCDIQNNQGRCKYHKPSRRPRLIMLTETLIIQDITINLIIVLL